MTEPDAGSLALLAGIKAAIEACEAVADASSGVIEGGRAVLADDGAAIALTLYRDACAVSAVTLTPGRAIALAKEMIAAALPRFSPK